MKQVGLLIFLVSLFIFGGCSSKYIVQFNTTPQGATLICSGRNWGYTPTKLTLPEEVKQQPYIDASDCEAHWASGAIATYGSQVPIYPSGGTVLNLNRPPGPGYEIDAEFNLKLQQMQYQRRSLEAAERAAAAAERGAKAAEDSAFQNSLPTTCFNIGGMVTCN
jgi:hypothetical protein